MVSLARVSSYPAEVAKVALLNNSSRALQRQVDLTTAVCQERLLATHVRHVVAFVDLVSDRLPFDDALDIYVRILRLSPEQARNVGSRALAELGRRGGTPREVIEEEPREPVEPVPEEEGSAADSSGGRSDALFARLRRRVRGRVQEDLRERINLAAARAEDALLETHVQNALVFVRALGDELNAPEAVELYLETMMMPEGVADVIYNRALRILAEGTLPPVPGSPPAPADEVDLVPSGEQQAGRG